VETCIDKIHFDAAEDIDHSHNQSACVVIGAADARHLVRETWFTGDNAVAAIAQRRDGRSVGRVDDE
jgi:hypothetical protein